ncbi:Fe2+-dependent dioxygenase [Pusillimonas sp. DMV24BSW_D]|uniref:Fe2+-dependent dioxygenase n=1 Tax=Neopusillimonas aestuarii TaxID=2716226 RepID=UPI00140CAC26|nr:Fe2+-dependent dioxygenase [Pusillimonas sp. DMV24BSW_D]QIM49384.1 Fe2+-dependent dioxygenase [Pusillimonas sp. DMV24BSW_D]
MITVIPDLLSSEEVSAFQQALASASWVNGSETAGHIAAQVKQNEQLPLDHPVARELAEIILAALSQCPEFVAATLPARILPPRFNRYQGGGVYGNHIDNAVFAVPGSSDRLRSDISATLFLSHPDEYDGGELVIEDTYGTQTIKLPAGHLMVYPASSVHRVNPVSRGARVASFFWVQSLVREDHKRRMLLELDQSIQALTLHNADTQTVARLTGVYHNLIREWSNP